MNESLKNVVDQLPLMQQLFEHEIYLSVIDSEGILQGFVVPKGVTPQLKVGEPFFDPSGAFQKVIATGMPQRNHLPKEVMGEAFEGMLVPIKDGREVVGCITCTYSVDIKEQNIKMTEHFQEAMRNVGSSVRTIINGIEDLSKMLTKMNEVTNIVESDVHSATEVVGKISSNASRSNILALNASIEAARSGEHGLGFTVVASEMGKLAKDSGSSAADISSTLQNITGHLVSIISSIKDANNIAQVNMDNISSIQKILDDALLLAEQLEKNVNSQS